MFLNYKMVSWQSCLLLFVLQQQVPEWFVVGLQLEKVFVPETGLFGQSATLQCRFILETDHLWSVKWYKDDSEFFKYSPYINPAVQQYAVSGVFVQPNSTMRTIILANLTFESTGNYMCEVTADDPSLSTVSQSGNLTVVILPDPERPIISNIPSRVRLGEWIGGYCTSFRSHPPANLTLYINGIEAEESQVIKLSPMATTQELGGDLVDLYTSVTGFNFTAGTQYFCQGTLTLGCSAKVGTVTNLTSQFIVRLDSPGQFARNNLVQ